MWMFKQFSMCCFTIYCHDIKSNFTVIPGFTYRNTAVVLKITSEAQLKEMLTKVLYCKIKQTNQSRRAGMACKAQHIMNIMNKSQNVNNKNNTTVLA